MNPLNFTIEQQICSEWCWAAVASAVCKCYNDPDAPSQRDVVDIVLGAPSGSQCNCEEDLSFAPREFFHFLFRAAPLIEILDNFARDVAGHGRIALVDIANGIEDLDDLGMQKNIKRPILLQLLEFACE